MRKFLINTSIIILFCRCSSSNELVFQSNNEYNQYVREYQKMKIDSIIQHNDYTIIFGWAQWCAASQSELKDHLIPFLTEIPDNIGVVSICCADADKMADFLKANDCKYPVFLLQGSWSGLDKMRLNKRFHALFNNYKSVNYVPIVILCNSQKQILNRDTINNRYDGISYSIHRIKNGIF